MTDFFVSGNLYRIKNQIYFGSFGLINVQEIIFLVDVKKKKRPGYSRSFNEVVFLHNGKLEKATISNIELNYISRSLEEL
jgi:hypothetical protein